MERGLHVDCRPNASDWEPGNFKRTTELIGKGELVAMNIWGKWLGTSSIFFNDWESLIRTLVIGFLAYVALVVGLRISGNRTLSKMNAFDFVVTIALGSTLATILLNKQTSLAEGVVAFGLLIGLQFIVTWTSARAPWVKRVVTGEPRLLFYNGQFLYDEMKRSRITKDEVLSAIRSAGSEDIVQIGAVVLETDGSCSVVSQGIESRYSSVNDVQPQAILERRHHSQTS